MPLLIRGARQLITLQGAAGPRRGPDLSDLRIIADGALLIENGRIEQVGPTRRVEHLAAARKADVIDASGRIVMPAFIDPLALPLSGPAFVPPETARNAIRAYSAQRMDTEARRHLATFARHGTVTLGGGCSYGFDDAVAAKALRVLGALNGHPLRILPQYHALNGLATPESLALLRGKKLAFAVASADPAIRESAAAAGLDPILLEPGAAVFNWCGGGVVRALIPGQAYFGACPYPPGRVSIDRGDAIALATGYDLRASPIASMPMVLSLACTQMQMRAEEAIAAATINAAHALGVGALRGSLEAGKQADLLIVQCGDYRELAWSAGHHPAIIPILGGKPLDMKQFPRC